MLADEIFPLDLQLNSCLWTRTYWPEAGDSGQKTTMPSGLHSTLEELYTQMDTIKPGIEHTLCNIP